MKQVTHKKRYDTQDEFDQFTLHIDDDGPTRISKKVEMQSDRDGSIWYYVGFAGDLGFAVAVPIAGGAFLGYFLDNKMSTYPKATLSLLLFGVIISIVGFVKTIRDLLKR